MAAGEGSGSSLDPIFRERVRDAFRVSGNRAQRARKRAGMMCKNGGRH
jgi:hypothetical protein